MGGQNTLAQQLDQVTLAVPDSGIVEYLLQPDPTGQIDRYELNAKYIDYTTPIAIPDFVPPRQLFTQAYSRSFSFLQVCEFQFIVLCKFIVLLTPNGCAHCLSKSVFVTVLYHV